MGKNWMTNKLAAEYNHLSPGGSSEVRLLPSFDEGEIVHATTHPEKPSIAAMLTGVGECFYILKGEGELWRATGSLEHVVSLHPGRCVSIPPGISYQYRAIGHSMEFLVAMVPRWQKENWGEAKRRYWADDGTVVSAASQAPGPWVTVDLPKDYRYLAPDGSEIRLLTEFDAGGLAHCTLPAGRASGPVRQRPIRNRSLAPRALRSGKRLTTFGVHENPS